MPKAPTKIQPYQSLIEHPDMKPYPGVDLLLSAAASAGVVLPYCLQLSYCSLLLPPVVLSLPQPLLPL